MSTIRTRDGVQIYYKDRGSGQPIVFSQRVYRRMNERLREQGLAGGKKRGSSVVRSIAAG